METNPNTDVASTTKLSKDWICFASLGDVVNVYIDENGNFSSYETDMLIPATVINVSELDKDYRNIGWKNNEKCPANALPNNFSVSEPGWYYLPICEQYTKIIKDVGDAQCVIAGEPKQSNNSSGFSPPIDVPAKMEAASNLKDKFAAFVQNKKEKTMDNHTCKDCNQPLPTSTPYRSTSPQEIKVEDSNPLSVVRSKLAAGWSYLKSRTPKPMKWMFRSVSWVLVGAIVVSIALVAGYFIIRYLMWYLILALGKWLLDRISKGLPMLGISISANEGDEPLWVAQYSMGMLAVVGTWLCGVIGKETLKTSPVRGLLRRVWR